MTKGSLLARHFPLPSFFSGKRARVATVAAAGTLTLATVVSAAAAVLPAATSAASASTGTTSVTAFDHRQVAMATHAATTTDPTAGNQAADFSHLRAVAAEQHHAHEVAAAKASAAKAAAAHKAALAKAAAAKAAAAKAAKAKAAHPTGSPRQIAKQMLGQYGWKASQFSCLEPLWYHESGWNPSAMNPSSGAYGIPQALPGAQMTSAGSDWKTNPATQIRWGLTYIHDRYGSPCGAWAHEQSSNWY
jgi:transglycosylase-like protein with SLT domain